MSEYKERLLPNGLIEYVFRPINYSGPIAIDTTDFFRNHKRHPNDDELAKIINNQKKDK